MGLQKPIQPIPNDYEGKRNSVVVNHVTRTHNIQSVRATFRRQFAVTAAGERER